MELIYCLTEFPNDTRVLSRPMAIRNSYYERTVKLIESFIHSARSSHTMTDGQCNCFNTYIKMLCKFRHAPNLVIESEQSLRDICHSLHPLSRNHDRIIDDLFQNMRELTDYSNLQHQLHVETGHRQSILAELGKYYSRNI